MKKLIFALTAAVILTPVMSFATKYHVPLYLEAAFNKENVLSKNELETARSKFFSKTIHETIQYAIVLVHSKVMETVKSKVSDPKSLQEIEVQALLLVADDILATQKGTPYAPEYIAALVSKTMTLYELKMVLKNNESEIADIEQQLTNAKAKDKAILTDRKQQLTQKITTLKKQIASLENFQVLRPNTMLDYLMLRKSLTWIKKNPVTLACMLIATVIISYSAYSKLK